MTKLNKKVVYTLEEKSTKLKILLTLLLCHKLINLSLTDFLITKLTLSLCMHKMTKYRALF